MAKTHASANAAGSMQSFHPLVIPYLEEMSPQHWRRLDTIQPGQKRNFHLDHLDPHLEVDLHADENGRVWLEALTPHNKATHLFLTNTYCLDHPLPGRVSDFLIGMTLSVLAPIPGAENCTITMIDGKYVHFTSGRDDLAWNEFQRPTAEGWKASIQSKRLKALLKERLSQLGSNVLRMLPFNELESFLRGRIKYPQANRAIQKGCIPSIGQIVIPPNGRYIAIQKSDGGTLVHKGSIILDHELPQTMRNSLMGRSARNLIDHDLFENVIIGRIEERTSQSILHLKSPKGMFSLKDVLGARKDFEDIEKLLASFEKEAIV